jgi:type VI secretion system secreted protein VgrG
MAGTLEVRLQGEQFTAEQVLAFREEHVLGQPSEVVVRALLPDVVPLDDLIGTACELTYAVSGEESRFFRGIVESVELEGNPREDGTLVLPTYLFRVVSVLALLERSEDCRIFQELTVREIIGEVLQANGIEETVGGGKKQVDFRLTDTYPPREYCVQYRESALHFISRLCESDGIHFFSEQVEGEPECLVFADNSTKAAVSPEEALPVREASQQRSESAAVYRFDTDRALRSGDVTLSAYDFKRPKLDLVQSAQAKSSTELSAYDFSNDYVEVAEGKRLSQVRLEQARSACERVFIEADSASIKAGHALKISGALGDDDSEYFVVSAVHEYRNDRKIRDAGHEDASYRVQAELVPKSVRYRVPARHGAPVIDGPQTATVVAPKDSPSETIHTDEHGRCRVRFHWDRAPDTYDRASCWMRVSQLQTSGSMVLPRVDWEVVVEFLEGNPDHPVVTGRLFNDKYMPPYALPEGRTRTSLKTASTPSGGGANEVRFEDKAGSEEILISSQYNTGIAAANNRKKTVGKDETLVVGNNAQLEVGANQDIQITNGSQTTIGADQTTTVSANRTVGVNAVYGLTVGGSSASTVGGNQFEMVGNPLEALLSLAASKAIALASAEVTQMAEKVQGMVQGAVNQVLGPIQDLQDQVEAMSADMAAVNEGALAASAGLSASVAGLPTMDDLSRSAAAGPAGTREGPEDSSSSVGISGAALANAAMLRGMRGGIQGAKNAAGAAQGQDGASGGGKSLENVGGPAGDLAGFSESDTAAGAGYSQYTVKGAHTEKAGGNRITAAAGSIMVNAKSESESIGAALVEIIKGDRAESVEGASSETEPALVMVVGGNSSQVIKGALNTMAGGAVMETIGGNRTVEAKSSVNLIGATHALDAQTKITFKCGASSIVIDGSGITIQSAMVSIDGSSITLPKNVNDG